MSMILKCESEYDLSGYYGSYGIIKCSEIPEEMTAYFNLSQLWTVCSDFFDEMVTDAYNVWNMNIDSRSVLLMDMLEEIVPLCSQVAMYWVSFDKDKMIYFNDVIKYKEGVKRIILSDYKCMFHCWYRNPKCFS